MKRFLEFCLVRNTKNILFLTVYIRSSLSVSDLKNQSHRAKLQLIV